MLVLLSGSNWVCCAQLCHSNKTSSSKFSALQMYKLIHILIFEQWIKRFSTNILQSLKWRRKRIHYQNAAQNSSGNLSGIQKLLISNSFARFSSLPWDLSISSVLRQPWSIQPSTPQTFANTCFWSWWNFSCLKIIHIIHKPIPTQKPVYMDHGLTDQ